jgi:hypothetical protein
MSPDHTEVGGGRWRLRIAVGLVLAAAAVAVWYPSRRPPGGPEDVEVHRRGSIEVTAQLEEVPSGAIIRRELYDYATVLKYRVLSAHRGGPLPQTIYVAHYNPFKARAQAADKHVQGIGGNVSAFAGGQVHRMALEGAMDRYYMGAIVNKYLGQDGGAIYWALWTNLAEP